MGPGPVTHRLALVCSIGLLAFAGGGQAAVSQTIYAWFDAGGRLQLHYADSSDVCCTIPAGTYTLAVTNGDPGAEDASPDHLFHLSGPGVDFRSPGAQANVTVTFQSGGTYTVQDDMHPAVRMTITVGGAGSAAPTGTTTIATSSTGASPTGSTKKKVITPVNVGSASQPFRGTLAATVNAAGKLTLTFNRKNVTAAPLKAGRYTISVTDQSKTVGFTIERIKGSPTTMTSGSFVGKKAKIVPLKIGQWFFFFGSSPTTYFFVVA